MGETADVVVVGGGVVGCSAAYHLALNGARVCLLEREAVGSGASGHATGFLGPTGSEFSPGPSFELALAGYDEFKGLVPLLEEQTGVDLLYQRRPLLRLALDEEEEDLLRGFMSWQGRSVAMKWIGGDEVRRIEPRLAPTVRGAVYEEEAGQLDSYRLVLALAQAAEKHGARIMQREVTGLLSRNGQVEGVVTPSGGLSCHTVVVAAGVWSAAFAEWLRFPIPVSPLKGERLMLRYAGSPLPVLIFSPNRGHMFYRLDGLLSVGSTGGRDYELHEPVVARELDHRPTEAAKIELLQKAVDVFPGLEEAELVHHLAGSRPLSPDRVPIIGPVPGWEGVVLATGHTSRGIHLGPITGRIVADQILQGRTDVPVETDAFLPSRFANLPDRGATDGSRS